MDVNKYIESLKFHLEKLEQAVLVIHSEEVPEWSDPPDKSFRVVFVKRDYSCPICGGYSADITDVHHNHCQIKIMKGLLNELTEKL